MIIKQEITICRFLYEKDIYKFKLGLSNQTNFYDLIHKGRWIFHKRLN